MAQKRGPGGRDVAGAGGEQHQVGLGHAERRFLAVDHHEIEADGAEDLDRLRVRQLDEGAEQRLARPQPLPEPGGTRSRARHAVAFRLSPPV